MFEHQHRFDRRKLLQLAGLGSAAWMTQVANVLAKEAEKTPRGKPAKSIILLWLAGGPSQLETFDPHPGSNIAGALADALYFRKKRFSPTVICLASLISPPLILWIVLIDQP